MCQFKTDDFFWIKHMLCLCLKYLPVEVRIGYAEGLWQINGLSINGVGSTAHGFFLFAPSYSCVSKTLASQLETYTGLQHLSNWD